MYPPFSPELDNPGIYERVAGSTLQEGILQLE